MLVSARVLKWLLRFYPPLFFQRIWTVKICHDFTGITLKISKSVFNTNYNHSIFGGTIFSAADICYPVLFHQIFSNKGYSVAVWSRSAEIHFIKKITNKVVFSVNLSAEQIQEVEVQLNQSGKFIRYYPIVICNMIGEVCADLKCEVYIRDLTFTKPDSE
ncbi:DUF4442 domain-containing protein [Mucilaginibacter auburnensis]|uniref:Putative thioesterase YiiD n=1 Tax=Mucilaginibacter auburnensis TaxID=1457233 RepID=A0A2H9VL58_9SPHI|nr:DUF4442 domain-containing protein [Mucilaginibacter auburnensis]PJJ79053.1 putative thioesterase YiiD [Mucilaginibacter auburnensis]